MRYFHIFKNQYQEKTIRTDSLMVEISHQIEGDIYVDYNLHRYAHIHSKILSNLLGKDKITTYKYGEVFEDNKQREGFENFCFRIYENPKNIKNERGNVLNVSIKMEMCT